MYSQHKNYIILLLVSGLFVNSGLFAKGKVTTVIEDGAAERKKSRGFFEASYDVGDTHKMETQFSGRYTQEGYGAARTSSLSTSDMFDRQSYARSTVDLSLDFGYGPKSSDLFNIKVHTTLRMRHRWGGASTVSTDSIDIDIVGVTASDTSATITKHIFYAREAWMKIMLGDLEGRDSYLHLGLVPFSVGHGISLGSAYKASGFLGFNPGFSIDQYAPGAVLRYDFYPKYASFDSYFALLENKHTSRSNNAENIRKNEILENGKSTSRGTHSHAYLLAFRSKLKPVAIDEDKCLEIEPYVVYQHAPDQNVEFSNDSNVYAKTFGVSTEFKWNRFQIGAEFAVNRGHQVVKAWDRNDKKLTLNTTTGAIEQTYTKIYSSNSATPASLDNLAVVTGDASTAGTVAYLVENSVRDPKNNSFYDATDSLDVSKGLIGDVGGTYYFNAVDRFRPKQVRHFEGWFLVCDGQFDIKPDVLSMVIGGGWASGQLGTGKDLNQLDSQSLLQETYGGFIPLQSVYSGGRLRHFVMLSGQIPRFSQEKPWESSDSLSKKNVITPVNKSESVKAFSNLSFIGGSLDWKAPKLKKYKFHLASNVIHYWSPESPTRVDSTLASSSLGTEVSFEGSFVVFDRIKISGYTGVFFPGAQYVQMKEDGAFVNKITTGSAPAYVFNLGVSFAF